MAAVDPKNREVTNMTREEHIERHKELHDAMDELLGDWVDQVPGASITQPISELMRWSFHQMTDPTQTSRYD